MVCWSLDLCFPDIKFELNKIHLKIHKWESFESSKLNNGLVAFDSAFSLIVYTWNHYSLIRWSLSRLLLLAVNYELRWGGLVKVSLLTCRAKLNYFAQYIGACSDNIFSWRKFPAIWYLLFPLSNEKQGRLQLNLEDMIPALFRIVVRDLPIRWFVFSRHWITKWRDSDTPKTSCDNRWLSFPLASCTSEPCNFAHLP